jgi:hypothetical protein
VGTAADKKQSGLPNWLWTLLIIVPGLIICRMMYWWLLTPSYRRKRSVEIKTPRSITPPERKQELVRDDLTRIKGIGPKTAEALNKAGVFSYTRLALLKEDQLEEIFKAARARMTDFQSVHKQSKMAANQDWDGLAKFQQEN